MPGWARREDRGLEGIIPNPNLKLLDRVREVLRLKHYSIRTESCYCDWIRRYVRFHKMQRREELTGGEAKIELFLSDLAVNGHVAASTQNQAFNALLFLYREVLHQELQGIQAVRADRPVRVPVVLTPEECKQVIARMTGTPQLVVKLLYGSGLRLIGAATHLLSLLRRQKHTSVGRFSPSIQRPPKVPRRGAAVGSPPFAELQEFFRSWQVFPAVSQGEAFTHTVVGDRQNIGTAQCENQKHFNCPWAYSTQGSQPLQDFFIGHLRNGARRRNDPVDGPGRDILNRHRLGPRQARGPEPFIGRCNNILRSRKTSVRIKRFHSSENSGGGGPVELLIYHRAHQRLKRGAAPFGNQLAWTNLFDELRQHFI